MGVVLHLETHRKLFCFYKNSREKGKSQSKRSLIMAKKKQEILDLSSKILKY